MPILGYGSAMGGETTARAEAVGAREGALLLALTVVFFGTGWPLVKIGLANATPLWFAVARTALCAAVAAALLVALGRFAAPGRGDRALVFSVGGLQMAAFFACTHLGLLHLPTTRAIVLAYTTPLWVVPLGRLLLDERIGGRGLAGCAIGLAGVAVLLGPAVFAARTPAALAGEAWLLAAALTWALAIVHARRGAWRLTPLQMLPWQMGFACLLLALAALAFEPDGRIGGDPGGLAALAWLGLVVGPVGAWAASAAARGLPAHVSALGFLGVPVLGVAASALGLGERIGADVALGGALVLAGLALAGSGSGASGWKR
jgi:drug/metabolite transporter (DMT)-like permease